MLADYLGAPIALTLLKSKVPDKPCTSPCTSTLLPRLAHHNKDSAEVALGASSPSLRCTGIAQNVLSDTSAKQESLGMSTNIVDDTGVDAAWNHSMASTPVRTPEALLLSASSNSSSDADSDDLSTECSVTCEDIIAHLLHAVDNVADSASAKSRSPARSVASAMLFIRNLLLNDVESHQEAVASAVRTSCANIAAVSLPITRYGVQGSFNPRARARSRRSHMK
jgi:hypothetical protein